MEQKNINRIEKHHITPKCLLKHKDKSFINRPDNIAHITLKEHKKAHRWLFMLLGDACGLGICRAHYTMKMRHLLKGKPLSSEHKKKKSESKKGKKLSEETKKKMSIAHTGKKQSEETKKKRSASNTGKNHSEETRRKISESIKRKVTTKYYCYGVVYNSLDEVAEVTGIKKSNLRYRFGNIHNQDFFYC